VTGVTGWRYWSLASDGTLASPLLWGGSWQPGTAAAACPGRPGRPPGPHGILPDPHGIPDPRCGCGWRVMTSLQELFAVWQAAAVTRQLSLQARLAPLHLDVCGQATLSGRICGPDLNSDPCGTLRGQYGEVTGPLATAAPAPLAAALAARYGTRVIRVPRMTPAAITSALLPGS